ncbi:zinc finger MYM-type protein 3-like [Ruditapes philippinarum]|uniref:zinc finger MYM-type protein 3-like n=1 Tax=Ruditapes philippinarum TaxID=129788 RepID=UPI00295BC75D|nr:zinc finger MYM-type protein 3-like [Ruditapes philippinarum]
MEQSSDQVVFEIMNIDDDFYRNYIFEPFPVENADVTVSQLLTINTQDLYATENKENCSDTSRGNISGRFEKPLSSDDIKKKQRNTVPYNTTKNNNWAVHVWREWAENRNLQPETKQEPGYPIPVEIEQFRSYAEMDFWLQRFICEIKRKNGEFYPPTTLQNIAAGLQRYLRNEKSMHVNFFKTDDPVFTEFRRTLDSRMRELTNEGIGIEVKSADAVTEEDEACLWGSGVFSVDNAKGLSNAVFFYNGKVFGLRGGDEQIGLQAEQFITGYDSAIKRRFVKFLPRIRKNTQGGLKQSKKAASLMQPIIHYDQEKENSYSIYKIYESYLNLIPRRGNFYRKPLDGLNFSSGTIPQKDLKGYLKNMFIQAGIPLDNRNISNHSGRVTLCTKLFNKRYSDKTVKKPFQT